MKNVLTQTSSDLYDWDYWPIQDMQDWEAHQQGRCNPNCRFCEENDE